jgi:hypothetical protein
MVITADALHTQRGTAQWLHQRGADFVFSVRTTNRACSRAGRPAGPTSRSPTSAPRKATGITAHIQVRSAPD